MPARVDELLRRLRTSTLDRNHPGYSKQTAAAWDRLTTAAADWVDTMRLSYGGDYELALDGLQSLVEAFPPAPKATEQDFEGLELMAPERKAIEAPKPTADPS